MEKWILFAAIGIIATIFVYLILAVIEKQIEQRRSERYIVLFSTYYMEEMNIRRTWEKMLLHYPNKNSIEVKTINRSLFYLDHSIMKDYKTALRMAEETFKGDSVHMLHEKSLENIKKILALPVKN